MSTGQKINLLLSCYQVLQPLTILLLAVAHKYVPKGHMNWIIYIPFAGVRLYGGHLLQVVKIETSI